MMTEHALTLLSGNEIGELLTGQESAILAAVERAYSLHARGQSHLPFSSFLRFPDRERERIIALPAYLGDGFQVAGIKWVASFPDNVRVGLDRASAVLILNDLATGYPVAILESSIISAKRTAASAALAARLLWSGEAPAAVGLVGCGLINFEILRFLLTVHPTIRTVHLCDLSAERAALFATQCARLDPGLEIQIVEGVPSLLDQVRLVSFATSATRPHVFQSNGDSLLLHISLRDLTPATILASDNVVDDVDHVCRAQTSVHLAAEEVGHRAFIRCTLGQILTGAAAPRGTRAGTTIFSPFGLGILDLAVGRLVLDRAAATGRGLQVEDFLPTPWTARP